MSESLAVPDKRFIFNGSALAFGARIRRPDDAFVKVAAPSHIPVSGGLSEALLDSPDVLAPFHYKDLITFSSASSSASGDFLDPKLAVNFTNNNHGLNNLPTKTSVEACLKDLRINQMIPNVPSSQRIFTAKHLEVQMTSTANRVDPVSFSSLGAKYDTIQLEIGESGKVYPLHVEVDTEVFSRNDTKKKLIEAYKDAEFRKQYSHMLLPLGEEDKSGIGGLLAKHEITNADKSYFVATIVKSLKFAGEPPQGTEILGNRLTIEGFGRIFFGEIIIYENERRVTLLRFEFGSPDGGDGTAGDVGSNGGGMPPSS